MSIFDIVYERRHTDSVKWDKLDAMYRMEKAADTIPMWIADMDFKAPAVIENALIERAKQNLFGYTYTSSIVKNAIVEWQKRRNNWTIAPEWILFHEGVVPAISTIIEVFTKHTDTILVNTPIYPPFIQAPKTQKRNLIFNPLIEAPEGYTFDFKKFDTLTKDPNVKLFIFCHPHNPVGRVWTEAELKKISAICAKNDVLIISDEIHSDLTLPHFSHIPLAKVSETTSHIITLTAPTKTFNIAGVQAAFIIVENIDYRKALLKDERYYHRLGLNTFANAAVVAAYSKEGALWLEELQYYLAANRDYVTATLQKSLPLLKVTPLQATYLMWLDVRAYAFDEKELLQALLLEGVAVDIGSRYGNEGNGFLRMNIACPKETLQKGVARFIAAFQKLQNNKKA